ncbi:hypothetical protein F52700_938 [Fusarium sp. NRRL 52700]|nr:hypothetical protein F52700_938 [Fusarium sp. NRRL 52700]
MYISNQPISPLTLSPETLHSAPESFSGRQAESDINPELNANSVPPSSPRRQLINRYWKAVFTLTIILFIFAPTRFNSPAKLDEVVVLQMAQRMNNLAVPCPKVVSLNIHDDPPINQHTVVTLAKSEKLPQEYLRQGHALYCNLMNPDFPWPNDFRYIYALPEDIVRYLLLETNTSVYDEPIVAPLFERSRRIVLVEKERRRRLARIIERKIEELYIQKGFDLMKREVKKKQ